VNRRRTDRFLAELTNAPEASRIGTERDHYTDAHRDAERSGGGSIQAPIRAPRKIAANPIKPVTADKIIQTRRNIREPTKLGERKIHERVLSCTRAHQQIAELGVDAKIHRASTAADPFLRPLPLRLRLGAGYSH
jgi:hypothetical protein